MLIDRAQKIIDQLIDRPTHSLNFTLDMRYTGRNGVDISNVEEKSQRPVSYVFHNKSLFFPRLQGPVVQSWVSTNSWLKFNPMFQFLYFYISVYFKTLQTKTTIDPDKISKEISHNTINKPLESLERNFALTRLLNWRPIECFRWRIKPSLKLQFFIFDSTN